MCLFKLYFIQNPPSKFPVNNIQCMTVSKCLNVLLPHKPAQFWCVYVSVLIHLCKMQLMWQCLYPPKQCPSKCHKRLLICNWSWKTQRQGGGQPSRCLNSNPGESIFTSLCASWLGYCKLLLPRCLNILVGGVLKQEDKKVCCLPPSCWQWRWGLIPFSLVCAVVWLGR